MRSTLVKLQTLVWVFTLAVAGMFGVATAQVTISTSSDPTVQPDTLALSSGLTRLLSHERSALSRLSVDRMRVISSAPSVSLRPAARGENHASIPAVSYTRKWVANQPIATGGADWRCLSEALYFEARGESVKGQFAVAEVILNRVKSSKFPSSVCAVVNQGTGKRNRCQFSYTCDGNPENIHEPAAYRNVGKIARALLDGAPRNLTVGATYYHNHTVRPRWSRVFTRTASIDGHYFYR